ncbi:MAG: ABC transporter substrate-binding protein [Pseudomonadota bacterium]
MRYFIISLFIILLPWRLWAYDIEDRIYLGPQNAPIVLKIISTADTNFFRKVIEDFLTRNTGIAIDYVVVSSSDLMTAISENEETFDLAISSAMDLQTKLANDSLTSAHQSDATNAMPDWARWRQEVFAFTQEPAAIVLSAAAFDGLKLPKTRQDLIEILRDNPDRFAGRVGTYDLRKSGAGYLFATQDSRTSEVYWRLTEVMGGLDAKLYCCTSDMLNDIASGDLLVAYNALATYALSREDAGKFIVIYPQDFTTVMMRTVLIPATAENKAEAARFIDYLIDIAWAGGATSSSPLSPLSADLSSVEDAVRRIPIDPGLLIFLDEYKRQRFLSAWEDAILQE